jgi:hypothetical protein
MSMEKNGAISSSTPNSGCCGGSCHTEKQATTQTQLRFPDSAEAADQLEGDLTKKAIDEVQAESQKPT